MTDKNYVQRQISIAQNSTDERVEKDALYRAGTALEVIPCDGGSNLTIEQQKEIYDAADKLLGE